MPASVAQKDTKATTSAENQINEPKDTPSPDSKIREKEPSKTLIRKFSLGGDAWNKKKRSSAVGSKNGDITEKEEEVDDRLEILYIHDSCSILLLQFWLRCPEYCIDGSCSP